MDLCIYKIFYCGLLFLVISIVKSSNNILKNSPFLWSYLKMLGFFYNYFLSS